MHLKNLIFIFFSVVLMACENDLQYAGGNTPDLETLQKQFNLESQQLQLEQEKQNLEYQKQNLDALKSRHAQQTQQVGSSYPTQIYTNNIQIQNFTDILQNLKSAENDVNQAAAAVLREQNSAAQLARDQIEPAITKLEQNILQTQEQIYVWTNNVFPLMTQQQSLLQGLQNQLAFQQQQLDLLNAQRLNISAEVLQQTRFINSATQQQKSEIVDSQIAVQDEIFSLRTEVNRLQTAYSQTRMSLVPLSQQIAQAQKVYDDQEKKVRALEENLKKL